MANVVIIYLARTIQIFLKIFVPNYDEIPQYHYKRTIVNIGIIQANYQTSFRNQSNQINNTSLMLLSNFQWPLYLKIHEFSSEIKATATRGPLSANTMYSFEENCVYMFCYKRVQFQIKYFLATNIENRCRVKSSVDRPSAGEVHPVEGTLFVWPLASKGLSTLVTSTAIS